ncbi:uncharacterized protein [Antedon mediterranea]|uniref:uncharacterized protein n=1 Tax=Antedon mediterranea TaxID=105859 RepID=UPI003AF7989B
MACLGGEDVNGGRFTHILMTVCFLIWLPLQCNSQILINEINADNPLYDIREFIELVNNGTQAVNLSSYSLVLYNGNNNRAYRVKPLSGMLNPGEFFVMGSANVRPVPDLIISRNIIQNGLDAVALYNSSSVNLYRGMRVTNDSLIDAVVYDDGGFVGSHTLLDVLMPGQTAVHENAFASPVDDESISRCDWSDVRNSSHFAIMLLTPGQPNPCNSSTLQNGAPTIAPITTTSPMRISEINADNPGSDYMEFIELYNNGNIQVNLDNYTVALFNGRNNRLYRLFYLTGYTVDARGYFLMGSHRIRPSPNYIVPNNSNANFLQSGPDGVALYYGDPNAISTGMRSTSNLDLLVDAVVYDRRGGRVVSLSTVLTPGEGTIHEDRDFYDFDESVSRCRGMDVRKSSPFKLTPATPGGPNNCTLPEATPTPAPTPPNNTCEQKQKLGGAFINELHIWTDGPQYIEIIFTQNDLENYILAIFTRNSGSLYRTIHLEDYKPTNGYLVIGHASDTFSPDIVIDGFRFLQSGINGVALYYEDTNVLIAKSEVTICNLVDAVVYGRSRNVNNNMQQTLIPGQTPLRAPSGTGGDVSLGRCRGWKPVMLRSFKTMSLSPGLENNCQIPELYINEINIYQTADSHPFVEIYDGGVGYQSLDGINLLLYRPGYINNGFDLTGATTDRNGYFVLSSVGSNITQFFRFFRDDFLNPPQGVSLVLCPPDFRLSTQSNINNRIDAVVYGEEVNVELIEELTPGQDQVTVPPEPESILRCDVSERISNSMFGHGPVSKWQLNDNCRRNGQTMSETTPHYQDRIRINEINVNQPGHDNEEFIELLGLANTSLDSLKVVLFNGNDRKRAYKVFDLTGYRTDSKGFFLIGAPVNGSQPQIVVTDRAWLQNGPDAVGLYKNSSIALRDQATTANIIDAIVYGTRQRVDRRLLRLLVPGQIQIKEDTRHHRGDESIIRCHSKLPLEQYSFDLGYPSPGQPNKCPPPPVFINEVNVHAEGHTGVFVELITPGKPNFPLDDLILVEYVGDNKLNKISMIKGRRTNKDGLLILAQYSSPLPFDVILFVGLSQLSNSEGAIALFHSTSFSEHFQETPPSEGLVDAIIFKKQIDGPHPWSPPLSISFSSSVSHVVTETWDQSTSDESINRCEYANETIYIMRTLSPKMLNHCPPRHNITLVINEINMVAADQFIEIWDLGFGSTTLDGFLIVLFSESGHSYFTIDLAGYSTDSEGYLVVGVRSTEPYPALVLAPGFIRTSSGAVTIYKAAFEIFADEGRTRTEGLIDSVVYNDYVIPLTGWTSDLYSVLPPIPSSILQSSGQSLSRCFSLKLNSPTPFVVSDPSPESLNACPIQTDDILINEIKVVPGSFWYQQPGIDYIELRSSNGEYMDLTGTSVVLYSGNDQNRVYSAYDLAGYSTNDDGYFLLSNDKSIADYFIDSGEGGFLQMGPAAVTIYRAPSGAFLHGQTLTTTSLIDTVVYTFWEDDPSTLVDELVPGQSIILLNEANNKTVSRCYGKDKRHQNAFVTSKPSPNRDNKCKANTDIYPAIVINELNVDNAESDTHEYIELYDFGVGRTKLDGLMLVFFDGTNDDRSYFEVDLTGQKTNRNGYFVIGSANIVPVPNMVVSTHFVQNGPDAVVLYHGTAQQFPRGSPISKENIVDALIYGTNDLNDRTLLDMIAPGQIIVNENDKHNAGEESMSRCLSNLPIMFSAFLNSQPTPGAFNNCTLTKILINEVNTDEPGNDNADFIELYDGGRGYASLDSLVVVIFGGGSSQSVNTIPLQNYRTDSNGYFLIGSGLENVDIDTGNVGFLQNGPGAVALYRGDHRNFSSIFPTRTHLEDVLVYSTNEEINLPLLITLLPGQAEVMEDPTFMEGDESMSRCFNQDIQSSVAFGLGKPTPKQPNSCNGRSSNQATKPRQSKIIINEINPSSSADKGPQFVELKGDPNHYLESFVIVFYEIFRMGTRIYYRTSLGKNMIGKDGYFVIGEQSMKPDFVIASEAEELIHSEVSAVALYIGTEEQFPIGGIVTTENLQDALIYTTYNTSSPDVTSNVVQELTSNQGIFYENNQLLPYQVSISRCACCQTKSTNSFMMSAMTPRAENICPDKSFLKTIQMRLFSAEYEKWKGDDFLLSALQAAVVKGIESRCQCGFSPAYLTRSKILKGSVVFQTDMSALNQTQADKLFTSYQDYIKDTPSVIVASMNFSVDTSCIAGCVPDDETSLPSKQQSESGMNAGFIVAVAVSGVTAVIIVTIIVFIIRKKQLCRCRRSISLDVDLFKVSKKQDLNDLDVLGTVHDYSNPSVDIVTSASSISGNVAFQP